LCGCDIKLLGAHFANAMHLATAARACPMLLWVQTFDTIEDLRQALLAFRESYNATWLIEGHGFITPAAFRQKRLQPTALAA
jgi:hypothetical protein